MLPVTEGGWVMTKIGNFTLCKTKSLFTLSLTTFSNFKQNLNKYFIHASYTCSPPDNFMSVQILESN